MELTTRNTRDNDDQRQRTAALWSLADRPRPSLVGQHRNTRRLARGLGWLSLGLGLAAAFLPRGITQLIGVRDDRRSRLTMRLLGVRGLGNGIGILANKHRRAPWVWLRVAGDVLDLALLGRAAYSTRRRRNTVGLAIVGGTVLGVTALDVLTAQRLSRGIGERKAKPRQQRVTEVLTIHRKPEEVYRFWRDFQNFPSFMSHVESVSMLTDRLSHWCVRAPAGQTVEWDAIIVEDRPAELLTWRSVEGADITSQGTVEFKRAPGGRGTELCVRMTYEPPAGRLGVAIAKLFGEEPALQIHRDLRRLKQVLETGSVVHSDASIHRGRHPARPRTISERKEPIP